jgi:protein-disulfide isomerase
MRRLLVALLLVPALIGAAAPAKDWRTTVVESSAGWTFGKAGAPLLTEYGSFGCPHCGYFIAEAGPTITSGVKSGKLRFSFRPFLIFPHDRAAAVLTRCVPSAKRLGFIEAIYAAQGETKGKLAAADVDEQQRAELYQADLAGPVPYAKAVARVSGLTELAAKHGLAAPAAEQCLSNQANYDWVANTDLAARTTGVKGTPTFEYKGARLSSDLTPEQLVASLPR